MNQFNWERVSWYRGRKCIVCKQSTNATVAPLGIVSGSFPCCMSHDDTSVMTAYFALIEHHMDARIDAETAASAPLDNE